MHDARKMCQNYDFDHWPCVQVGVDCGLAQGELHAVTGRMAYRGKVMNRAARIGAGASSGQVRLGAWRPSVDTE